MNRWRTALLAASVGSVAALGLVVLPDIPASAAPADLVVDYDCTPAGPDSIVRHGPVRLTTNLTFATDLVVGGPLNFTWKLKYANSTRFQSPNYFAAGAQVHAVGNVQLLSSWQGILQPKGTADQDTKLRPDSYLTLPETINDPGLMDKPGTIKVTPRDIEVDFTPPDGSVPVNDGNETDNPTDLQVKYSGTWTSLDDRPSAEHHVHNDLHETTEMGASAELTFVGTGVEYIGPTDKDAGTVDIYIDGYKVATVDPSRDEDNKPVNHDLNGGVKLWESAGLEYGKHTIKIVNTSTKPAWLDAFNVLTDTQKIPTGYHRAICKLVGGPVSVVVTVREASPSPTATSPTSPPPTTTTPPPSTNPPTNNPTTTGTPTKHITPPPSNNGMGHVIVVPPATGTSSSTPSSSAKPTATATATKYVKAQVAKTPKGGVDSGEAPDEPRPYGLMASGAVVLMGSATSGLLMRRRRAEHAGGLK